LQDAAIQLTPADLKKPATTPLEYLMGMGRDEDPNTQTEFHQAETYSRLLLEKAEDYLISNAVHV
jgi:hypothetical protein